jgi:excisionase family DNA binding protein
MVGDSFTELVQAVNELQVQIVRLGEKVRNLEGTSGDNVKLHLTVNEASEYLGIKKSQIYQLTHNHQIPFYKPSHKLIYFQKADLDFWINDKRVMSGREVKSQINLNS